MWIYGSPVKWSLLFIIFDIFISVHVTIAIKSEKSKTLAHDDSCQCAYHLLWWVSGRNEPQMNIFPVLPSSVCNPNANYFLPTSPDFIYDYATKLRPKPTELLRKKTTQLQRSLSHDVHWRQGLYFDETIKINTAFV